MPQDTTKSAKMSLPKLVTYIVAAIAILLVLRFVFSVAMSILKFVALGGLVLFVAWLFLSKDTSGKSS